MNTRKTYFPTFVVVPAFLSEVLGFLADVALEVLSENDSPFPRDEVDGTGGTAETKEDRIQKTET